MKPPRRIPDLADKPELHERERKRVAEAGRVR